MTAFSKILSQKGIVSVSHNHMVSFTYNIQNDKIMILFIYGISLTIWKQDLYFHINLQENLMTPP